jgi:alkanesulfonate monooxygenase
MALRIHWFLPSHGDGRELTRRKGTKSVQRPPTVGYLGQVARAADEVGFDCVLVPSGLFCEDPWLVSAALCAQTTRLRFMVALRPGFVAPTLVAQMAATLQRMSGGRLAFNIVVGGDADELRRYGDWLDHDRRYERAAEFLTVIRQAWHDGPADFEGEHYRVAGAMVARPAETFPEVFLGGSSEGAQRTAVQHADVYLAWGEGPQAAGERVAKFRAQAGEIGPTPRVGTRFNVITRDTADEAWAEADRLIRELDPEMVAAAQKRFQRSESEGQRIMAGLHGGRTDALEIAPNVWAGYGLVRPGAGTALVGSHEEVADRIAEYHSLGIEDLILSAQPHVEEAYRFGEGVLPLLRERGVVAR